MAFVFDSEKISSTDLFHFDEWLETDGRGGWASSTLSGANSRRYHGLLVAARNPPFDRQVLLAKLDETLVRGNDRAELGFNAFGSSYQSAMPGFLKLYSKDLFPTWVYRAHDIEIEKTVCAVHQENLILIKYQVLAASEPFQMELLPLVAGRDYHALGHANNSIRQEAGFSDGLFSFQPYGPETGFQIRASAADYIPRPLWYYNFFYKAEQERGQDCNEDLFNPGVIKVALKAGDIFWVELSAVELKDENPASLFAEEKQRRLMLLKDLAVDELSVDLILASDQFIIKKNDTYTSVIAGYHWFSDWGRDTMISLPGLCLVTRRFAESKEILRNFASHLDKGIIPNRFLDGGNAPEYNTVDATLWFFVACYRYVQYTGDEKFISEEILPVFAEIVKWHVKGTWYNIHVEHDGLLSQGADNVQLTWMDAKVGDWVVTPRTGKAVEVNALWYNALRIYSGFLGRDRRFDESAWYEAEADRVRLQFVEQFWIPEKSYLLDCIQDGRGDDAFRPNQLFALSLPFPLLEGERAARLLDQIESKLYTPKGLRSLSPDNAAYRPYYFGDKVSRDGAYHQGTVWSWLLGPYVDALISIRAEAGRDMARKAMRDFMPHLNEAGIGSVSEIFDATDPWYPKGCIAQAWGVAEILRVYMQYKLYR